MNPDFHVVIPARYASTRLPGKLMMSFGGSTIIERVYRQAELAGPKSICIATDSSVIAEHAQSFGAKVVMTAPTHQTGTDRIAEVITKLDFAADDIIVNVQGDEPLIAPALIRQVAQGLASSDTSMATLCWPIENLEQLHNPNIVKVVRDSNQNALYFSRAPIPFCRDNPERFDNSYRHIGLYAYRAAFLLDFVARPVADIESYESLEQLRVLWSGDKIRVDTACVEPLQDVNTLEDLQALREQVSSSLGL